MPDSTTVVHGTVNAGVVGSNPTRAVLTIPEAVFVVGAVFVLLVLFGALVVTVGIGLLTWRFARAAVMPPRSLFDESGIPHSTWALDPRVRRLKAEENQTTELLSKRLSRIIALLLAMWFCGVVVWYLTHFLATPENWASCWLIATYVAKTVGVIAALFGGLFFFGFLVSRGRLFLNDFDD